MPTFRSEHDDLIRRLREKSKLFDRGTAERPEVWFLLREAADALEAAQRPPVSPEAREEMIAVLDEVDRDHDPGSGDYASNAEYVDAILARLSVSSQPVYDEEKANPRGDERMRAYAEALADPKVQHLEPGIIMRPFHQPSIGQEQEWHVYCETHPEFGFCGVDATARDAALDHGRKAHR